MHLLRIVPEHLSDTSDLDVSVHGGGLGGPDQPLQLGAAEVLGLDGELLHVHVAAQQVELAHLGRVDVEDLDTALLIGQPWAERTGPAVTP